MMKLYALVPMNDPSPIGFMNVYDNEDIWLKVRGCEACDTTCCGNCPLLVDSECYLHIIHRGDHKPYHCIVRPDPLKHNSNCKLVWKCTRGPRKGQYRFKSDPQNVFRNEGP